MALFPAQYLFFSTIAFMNIIQNWGDGEIVTRIVMESRYSCSIICLRKKIQEFQFERRRYTKTEKINLLYLVLKGGKEKKK